MVMGGDGVQVPIVVSAIGEEAVARLIGNLETLGVVGQAAFSKLSISGQNTQLKLVQLTTAYGLAGEAVARYAAGTGTSAAMLEKLSGAALAAGNALKSFQATLIASAQALAIENAGLDRLAAALIKLEIAQASANAPMAHAIALRESLAVAANQAAVAEERLAIASRARGFAALSQGLDPFARPRPGPSPFALVDDALDQGRIAAVARANLASSALISQMGAGFASQMNVAPAISSLSELGAKLEESGARFEKWGTRARQMGMNVTMGIGLPIAAVGAVSIIAATKYETAMEQIQSQTGGTAAEVELMTGEMLKLARVSGQTPVALAEALFSIESVNIRGAAAVDAMTAATMGAVAGQADLEDVTKALAATMVSQVDGATNAAVAMGTMNAIVSHGRLNMDDFTESMSTGILAASRTFGVSLTDMGAAMVVLTNSGVNANSAATRLRMTFSLLSAPTDKAVAILDKLGLRTLDLSRAVRNEGLHAGLKLLKDSLEAFTSDPSAQARLISEAFGGGRTSTTLVTLLNQIDQVAEAHDQIAASAGSLEADYANMVDTFGFKWKSFVANLQVDAIKMGDAAKPLAEAMFGILPIIDKAVEAFTRLPAPARNFLLIVAGIAVAVGPLAIFIGAFATMIGFMASATGAIAVATAGLFGYSTATTVAAAATAKLSVATATLIARLGILLLGLAAVNAVSQAMTGQNIFERFSGADEKAAGIASANNTISDSLSELANRLKTTGNEAESFSRTIDSYLAQTVSTMNAVTEAQKEFDESPSLKIGGVVIIDYGLSWSNTSAEAQDALATIKAKQDALIDGFPALISGVKDTTGAYRQLRDEILKLPEGPQRADLLAGLIDAADQLNLFKIEPVGLGRFADGQFTDAMHKFGQAISDAEIEFEDLGSAIDDALKGFDKFDPLTEALEVQMVVLNGYKLELEATGQSTKDVDAQMAGLKNTIEQQSNVLSGAKSLVTLYGSQLSALNRSNDEVNTATQRLTATLNALPPSVVMQVLASLPWDDMDKVIAFLDLFSRGYSISVSLAMGNLGVDLQKGLAGIPIFGKALAEKVRGTFSLPQLLPEDANKGFGAGVAAGDTPSIYGGGKTDELNKTEFGLLALADAFKIFNAQTGSDSVDAFKAWLDLQKSLVEAQSVYNAILEQQSNPLLAMTIAMDTVRLRVLELKIALEQGLIDAMVAYEVAVREGADAQVFSLKVQTKVIEDKLDLEKRIMAATVALSVAQTQAADKAFQLRTIWVLMAEAALKSGRTIDQEFSRMFAQIAKNVRDELSSALDALNSMYNALFDKPTKETAELNLKISTLTLEREIIVAANKPALDALQAELDRLRKAASTAINEPSRDFYERQIDVVEDQIEALSGQTKAIDDQIALLEEERRLQQLKIDILKNQVIAEDKTLLTNSQLVVAIDAYAAALQAQAAKLDEVASAQEIYANTLLMLAAIATGHGDAFAAYVTAASGEDNTVAGGGPSAEDMQRMHDAFASGNEDAFMAWIRATSGATSAITGAVSAITGVTGGGGAAGVAGAAGDGAVPWWRRGPLDERPKGTESDFGQGFLSPSGMSRMKERLGVQGDIFNRFVTSLIANGTAAIQTGYISLNNQVTEQLRAMGFQAERVGDQINASVAGSSGGGSSGPSSSDMKRMKDAFASGSGDAFMKWIGAPGYASGIDFVPRDTLAFVHRGERIIPASENASGGRPTIKNFYIDTIEIHGDPQAGLAALGTGY